MKGNAEYLAEAAKYDGLAWKATNHRRRAEFAEFAAVYRYLAEEAAELNAPAEKFREVA